MDQMTRSGFFQELARRASRPQPNLRALFNTDPDRATQFRIEGAGICLDFSKHWIDRATWQWLCDSLDALGFRGVQTGLVSGDHLNYTEGRSVLHMALRGDAQDPFAIDGQPVMSAVLHERTRCDAFADAVRSGVIRGASGKLITDIVNIGIGGSDLGPLMACQALEPFRAHGPKTHFLSNVDPAHWASMTATLDPHRTLVIVASKTFTTQETMVNASRVKQWLVDAVGPSAVATQMIALSTNQAAVLAFGIQADRMFPFWDWVGGRYSLWSSIGMAIRCQIGSEQFSEFLNGARAMDQHFLAAPLTSNLPVALALLGLWYRNGYNLGSHAVIPYSQRMARFPAYLQQLEMESNGKQTDRSGNSVLWQTAPVIWGESGTNGQHAFHQLLHQGTEIIPVDFLIARNPTEGDQEAHLLLLANCLAQAEALAFGEENADPHRRMPGNRPSSIIGFNRLDPRTLGALIALYEHKVMTQGVLWGINSFDQFGVELGKRLCTSLAPALLNPSHHQPSAFSSSTDAWVHWIHH